MGRRIIKNRTVIVLRESERWREKRTKQEEQYKVTKQWRKRMIKNIIQVFLSQAWMVRVQADLRVTRMRQKMNK